ncbi:GNAT family N-acetyltransferase [Cnuella takakiae]|uniref:GNAT family N-acetyltransferase n=1 Tax=Cnuella takakiae TaxID=1302690 RepID=UPI0013019965|nr:GNAT family N-acetyltransferase [Cnuella takakiae]
MTLRQLSEADQHEVLVLRSDNQVNKYLERAPAQSLEEAVSFIHMINANTGNGDAIYWGITITGSNKIIGAICLFNFSDKDNKCEIGYELGSPYQGKKIMMEAAQIVIAYGLRVIGLKRMDACTHKANEASVRLLEKLKFQKSAGCATTNEDFHLFSLVA